MKWIALGALTAALIFVLPAGAASNQSLPPLQPDLNITGNWTCTAPQNRNNVRVNGTSSNTDAVNLRTNCSGRIGRLEITGIMADCVKINAPSPEAHDLVVESGFVFDSSTASNHKDGVQAMGGDRITFRNFLWDCGTPTGGTGGGHWFPAASNGGSPTFITCDHCAFLPRMNNQIAVKQDFGNSGVRNSLVCMPNSGRNAFTPPAGDLGGNTVVANTDTLCTRSGAAAWLGNDPPPDPQCSDGVDNDGDGAIDFPADVGCDSALDDSEANAPPPTLPAPSLTTCGEYSATFFACWAALSNVQSYRFSVDGSVVSSSNNPNLVRVKFGKLTGTHEYCVIAVYASGTAQGCLSKTR